MDSAGASEALDHVALSHRLQVLALTLLLYDHALTFGNEVKYIWSTRRSFGSIVFLLNRYFAFIANIVVTAMQDVPRDQFNCSIYSTFHSAVIVVNQIGVCILLTMRVYALYKRSKKILVFLLLIAAGLLGICAWAVSNQDTWQAPDVPYCHMLASRGSMIRLAVAWEGLLGYDCLVVGLTVYQSCRSMSSTMPEPLLKVVLRDGAMYFAVMALCNLGNIMTFYFANEYLNGCLSSFSSSVSMSVLCHLILHLHETGRNERLPSTQRTSGTRYTYNSEDVIFTSHITAESIGLDTIQYD